VTLDEVKTIYVALWRLAERRSATGQPTLHVRYNGVFEGEGGRFEVTDDASYKTIEVDRPFYDETCNGGFDPHWHRKDGAAVDVTRELCILAHEYGHSVSWERGHWTVAYRDALAHRVKAKGENGRISASDHALIFDEEVRAWDLGRAALDALGWSDREAFETSRANALKTYEDIAHD
jgi:hypothetical protein